MEPSRHHSHHVFAIVAFFVTLIVFAGVIGPEKILELDRGVQTESALEPSVVIPQLEEGISIKETTPSAHLQAPDPLHGIYLSAWTAGSAKGLMRTLGLFDDSILNAVIIDIKDATGKLSYEPLDPYLLATGVGTKRIVNLPAVIQEFHDRNIYVIGRLTVFQDPFYAALHPEDAIIDARTGLPWADYKGIKWLRPDSVAVKDYVAAIARDAYAQGFDEINVDYVRFPSDGELKYIDLSGFAKKKAETMQDFFTSLHTALDGIPVSADVFGLTMSANDDVGIGQKAALIAPSVDALAPMLYPSHFWNGTYGIPVPAAEPYKVIHKSLSDGIKKLELAGIDKSKIRPWFQDFDLVGVHYTPEFVRAQLEAAHDLGIESWMMWDPRNVYTKEVYKLSTE